MTKVFVYGTLMQGGTNHQFLAGQKFIGRACTGPGFTLYSIGDYPGMVRAPHDSEGVTGELWDVSDSCLHKLDQLEGVSEKLFERVLCRLQTPMESDPVHTYLYLLPLAGRQPIGSNWPVGPVT